MSSLFGHKKGSFTGAASDRDGLLKTADCGMLFLDEVGELGPDEQTMLLRAIEEKRFMPVGSDIEITSDFQLICGTNRSLDEEVGRGKFREDLFARINLWSFTLPGLTDRKEDIEPNLIYELSKQTQKLEKQITINREAKEKFLNFSTSGEALWSANFRDLNAAVTRMATLSPAGRITREVVSEEIGRLNKSWKKAVKNPAREIIYTIAGEDIYNSMDPFDRVQLAEVLKVCKESKNLSEAGRKLFSVSRLSKKSSNDADRLKKYLSRFNLTWNDIE